MCTFSSVNLLRENNANDAGSAIADLLANPALRENSLENVHLSQASLQGAVVSSGGEGREMVQGNVDEVQIGDILQKVEYLRNLEERKE